MKAYRDASGSVRLFRPDLNIRRLNRSMERLRFPTVDEASMIELIRYYSCCYFSFLVSFRKVFTYLNVSTTKGRRDTRQ